MTRWLNLVSCLLVMFGAGSTGFFAQYSEILKNGFLLDQRALTLVSCVKDTATNLGTVSEMLTPWSPICLILLGAVFNFTGSLLLYTSLTGQIRELQLWETTILVFFSTWGINLAETVVLMKSSENGSTETGWPLLQAFSNLSGAVVAHLIGSSNAVILFNAVVPSILFLGSICGIKETNENISSQLEKVSIGVAVVVFISTIVDVNFPLPRLIKIVIILSFIFMYLAINWNVKEVESSCSERNQVQSIENQGGGDPVSIKEALTSREMIFLIFLSICGMGSTTTFFNELSELSRSLGYELSRTNTLITLGGVWIFLGKKLSVYVSQKARALFLTFSLMLGIAGDFFVIFPFPGSLYCATICIGVSSGCLSRTVLLVIQESYGQLSSFSLFNFLKVFIPLGTVILNLGVTANLYDFEARSQVSQLKSAVARVTCLGDTCFKLSFQVLVYVQIFGATISLLLVKIGFVNI